MGILAANRPRSKPPAIKCNYCTHGQAQPGSRACGNCKAVVAHEDRGRKRREDSAIIERLASVAGCEPERLIGLLADIAIAAKGGAASA